MIEQSGNALVGALFAYFIIPVSFPVERDFSVQELRYGARRGVSVSHRRADIRVSQKLLGEVERSAGGSQPRGDRMPQIMEPDVRPSDGITRRIERAVDRCNLFG